VSFYDLIAVVNGIHRPWGAIVESMAKEIANLRADNADLRERVPVKDGQRLWLWREGHNFVAYANLWPVDDEGHPLTLGQPETIATYRESMPATVKMVPYVPSDGEIL